MDGTGKCYWLDCALLNAFFFFSSFFLLRPEFGLAVLRVLSICISPRLFIYLLLAPGAWEIIGSCLKVPAGENSYHVLARPTYGARAIVISAQLPSSKSLIYAGLCL